MSKSDEKLRQDLEGAGKTVPSKSDASNTTATASGTGDGAKTDAEATGGTPAEARTKAVRVPAGSKPSQVLRAHLTSDEELFNASRLRKGDASNSEGVFTRLTGVIDKLAKKVGEKAVNLIRHQADPSKVQVYTRLGLDELIAKSETNSKGLVDLFRKKYSDGTSRAQASQLMMLFPALGIAERDEKGMLTLNSDSVIVANYKTGVPSGTGKKTKGDTTAAAAASA